MNLIVPCLRAEPAGLSPLFKSGFQSVNILSKLKRKGARMNILICHSISTISPEGDMSGDLYSFSLDGENVVNCSDGSLQIFIDSRFLFPKLKRQLEGFFGDNIPCEGVFMSTFFVYFVEIGAGLKIDYQETFKSLRDICLDEIESLRKSKIGYVRIGYPTALSRVLCRKYLFGLESVGSINKNSAFGAGNYNGKGYDFSLN